MKHVSVSLAAELDIDEIASYTTHAWGWRQADRYLDNLEDSFRILAQHPSIGRSCDSIQSGLLRFEVGKHVVFYRTETGGIRVVRILHQQMIPEKVSFEQ